MILPMKKIDIFALLKDRKSILEYLQMQEVLEVTSIDKDLNLANQNKQETISMIDRNIHTLQKAISVLEEKTEPKKQLFSCREDIPISLYEKEVNKVSVYTKMAVDVVSLSKEISDRQTDICKAKNSIKALTPFKGLDIPMNFSGTVKTKSVIAQIPRQIKLEEISELPKELSVEYLDSVEDKTFILLICHRDVYECAMEILREIGISIVTSGLCEVTPEEMVLRLQNEILKDEEKITELDGKLICLGEKLKYLKFAYDHLIMRKEKYEEIERLGFTESTFLLTAYIEEARSEDLIKNLESHYSLYTDVYDIPKEEALPIKFKNNKFVEPVEGVVELYSMPSYGDIDPNTVMAPFYYLMFGLMLSDAAYGLILFLGCFFITKRFKLEEKMKRQMKMFMYCGASTVFWGVLFGSYFGDIVDVVSRTFFGREITIPPLWFSPLNNAMGMLLFSFALGFIHILIGMSVDFYMKCKGKKLLDGLADDVSWWLIFLGLGLIFSGMSFKNDILFNVGKYTSIFGVALIIILSGWKEKGLKKITSGLGKLYGITGYLSDILSYSRLLALGLATGVVASVVNTMGSIAGSGVLGAIIFFIVFILGHTLNIGINVLGAYVHTGRLQYVEFFSKFYNGGGKAFKPFSVNTKYFKFREDN